MRCFDASRVKEFSNELLGQDGETESKETWRDLKEKMILQTKTGSFTISVHSFQEQTMFNAQHFGRRR